MAAVLPERLEGVVLDLCLPCSEEVRLVGLRVLSFCTLDDAVELALEVGRSVAFSLTFGLVIFSTTALALAISS